MKRSQRQIRKPTDRGTAPEQADDGTWNRQGRKGDENRRQSNK
ncbi:hypothetical protein ACFVSS_14070 [Peribacillus butanolivorans]